LSVRQKNAAEALASVSTDEAAAARAGVSRWTVRRWRQDRVFWFEVLSRRQARWSSGRQRLAGLVTKAIDILAAELDDADRAQRLAAACAVLQIAELRSPHPNPEPTADAPLDALGGLLIYDRAAKEVDAAAAVVAFLKGGR